jgi:hypothetical protein
MSNQLFTVKFERDYDDCSIPLVDSFEAELNQQAGPGPDTLPAYKVAGARTAGNDVTLLVVFDCGTSQVLSRDTQRAILRDSLQYHFDQTGMAGKFTIIN